MSTPISAKPSFLKNAKAERGSTALQLLIVVAIIAIITGTAVPNITKTLELHRLDTNASELASKLMDTRMNAVKRNALHSDLTMNIAQGTAQISYTDSGGAHNAGYLFTLPQGVTFASTSPTIVTFTSLGRLSTSAQTIRLQSPSGHQITVNVSVSGEITVGAMS